MKVSPHAIALALVDMTSPPYDVPYEDACDTAIRLLHDKCPGYPLRSFAGLVAKALRKKGAVSSIGALRTAIPASAETADAVGEALGEHVDLHVSTDEELIGGAVLLLGDLRIDNSVSTALEHLLSTFQEPLSSIVTSTPSA